MPSRLPVVFAAAVLLAGCGDLFSSAAATVDDRVIDEETFTAELEFLLADPRLAPQLQGAQGDARRKELTRQFLTFQIHQQVVEQYAQDQGIEVPEAEVTAAFQAQVAQLGGPQAFERQLRAAGVDGAEVRDLVAAQVLREHVAESIVNERLPDGELRQLYEERLLEFTQARVAHILVETEEEARDILARATKQNFADLARRLSIDTSSAPNGGDLGMQRLADLPEPFAEAVLDAPIGEIIGPVQSEFGYHVIRVAQRSTRPFEEVRDQLVEEVRGQVFTDWLLAEVRAADIRVNPRFGAFDDSTGAVIERTSTTPLPRPSVQLEP